jgi:copper chaperone for superoxide dismutase
MTIHQQIGAAVCILETHESGVKDPVKGLARLVQVSSDSTVIDITLKGISPGIYTVSIRAAGDISAGAKSTGPVWTDSNGPGSTADGPGSEVSLRGDLGTISVTEDEKGADFKILNAQVWEIIGRSMVVQLQDTKSSSHTTESTGFDGTELVGVLARSAGVWDNDKTVSCLYCGLFIIFLGANWL